MQIDFSDKRVIAGLATAGIVAAVIIVLQSLILLGRPSAVAYAPQPVPVVRAPGQLSQEKQQLMDAIADEQLNNKPMSQEDLDTLNRLLEKRRRAGNPPLDSRCNLAGTVFVEQLGRCVR